MKPEDIVALVIGILVIPVVLALGKFLLWYVIIEEAQVRVYTLFGKVIGILDKPGLYFPVKLFSMKALLIPFFGKKIVLIKPNSKALNRFESLMTTHIMKARKRSN